MTPCGVVPADCSGWVYVADSANNRLIRVDTTDGTVLQVLTLDKSYKGKLVFIKRHPIEAEFMELVVGYQYKVYDESQDKLDKSSLQIIRIMAN